MVGLFQVMGAYLTGRDLSDELPHETTEQHLVISFFGLLGTLLVTYLFMKFVDDERFANIGLFFKNHKKSFLVGLLAGFLIMVFGYLVLYVFDQITFEGTQFLMGEFFMTLLLFLTVSISEELMFRGYVLRNLMGSMNNFIALLISAMVFALMHAANPNLSLVGNINLFLAGILLGLPYIYTKNLMFPIAFHFSWNFFQSVIGFNVSGIDSYSLITFKLTEDNIFNGGGFGFEGSVLATLFQILLILAFYAVFNWDKRKELEIGV
ncbi:CPBP family intramembrane glutamic endopeptidase [Flagellimonas sp.]|uniref:CPBP family intramembrane glutamic endopeptidase n=1 Tax=Flagellimonas sp. TaxID=2058762 RepID=UPI003BACF593